MTLSAAHMDSGGQMEVPSRAAYATREWVAIVGQEAARLLAAAGGSAPRFVLVERFLGAPLDRRPEPPLSPGYRLEIDGERVSVRFGVATAETGDLTVDVDFRLGERMCALPRGSEMDALGETGRAQGNILVTGDPAGAPIVLSDLHDAVAPRTVVF
jgi:hypothetical protein